MLGKLIPLLLAGLTIRSPVRRWPAPSPALSFNQSDQEMFDTSMQINDWSWENSTGWIEANDDYGHTSSRFTAWCAIGLLQRNQGEDLDNAIRAINNIIGLQYTQPQYNNTPWYWDYKQASDEPPPNNETFPSAFDVSWDPNWAFFIGEQFVQILSEFEHMLPTDLVDTMLDSMYKASRELMNRNGLNGDQLVTAYTNPGLGRALIVNWVGVRIGDQNLTQAGEQYAQDIYDLFTAEGYNTFGEYNAPTYYGEDVYSLCAWIRNAPTTSSLATKAKYMLQELWSDIAEHYNYNLKNIVGPYDRVYHRNSLIDDNIITLWISLFIGRAQSPVAPIGQASTLYDLRQGAAFSLLGQTLRENVNQSTVNRFTEYVGDNEREFTKYVRDSLDNTTTRVCTAWVAENLMAGGQQVAEEYMRSNQFTPMIAHWKSGDTSMPSRPYVSFFQLYNTCPTVNATVTPGHISVAFTNTTQEGTDYFRFLIGDIPTPFWDAGENMDGFNNLPCLKVDITSQGLNGTVVKGQYNDFSIQGNIMWTVDYYTNSTYEGTPTIDMDLTYTC